jgi:hypothetical protein
MGRGRGCPSSCSTDWIVSKPRAILPVGAGLAAQAFENEPVSATKLAEETVAGIEPIHSGLATKAREELGGK